jgi:hypothetical protein
MSEITLLERTKRMRADLELIQRAVDMRPPDVAVTECRYDSSGDLDEVVGYGHFHLERMGPESFCLIVECGQDTCRTVVNIHSRSWRASVDATAVEGGGK